MEKRGVKVKLKPLLFHMLSVALITASVTVPAINADRSNSADMVTLSIALAVTGLGLLWILSLRSGRAQLPARRR